MRRWGQISIVVAVIAVLSGCGGSGGGASEDGVAPEVRSDAPRAEAQPGAEQGASADEQAFAWDFFARLAGDENLAFSPYSIGTAAAMVSAGAAGETLSQLRAALHFTAEDEAFHAGQNALALALEARNHPAEGERHAVALRSSNALWLLPALRPPNAFLDTLAVDYGAGVHLAPFDRRPEEVREAINARVSDDTGGLIPDLLPTGSIDQGTVFVLTNALYFKASWETPFPAAATQNEPFHALDGSEPAVPMMRQTGNFPYAAGAGWQAVGLPYERGELEMLVVVPDADRFEEVRSGLDAALVADLVAQRTRRTVFLGLPRFTVRSNVPLAAALQDAGMVDAFSEARADFSGIADGVFLTAALHQAVVIVDEKGTEAAAATGFVGGTTSLPEDPVDLTVDRPFLFAIRDVPTGCVLFAGQVVAP